MVVELRGRRCDRRVSPDDGHAAVSAAGGAAVVARLPRAGPARGRVRDGFGAPLDLQLVEDDPIVALDSAQSEEEPVADLVIRESLGDQSQDFQFTLAERLDQGLGRRRGYAVFDLSCFSAANAASNFPV